VQQISSNQANFLQNSVQTKTLLFVGPKPPPIGGSPLTVQAMLEELAFYPAVQVTLINTSPALDVRRKMTGFNFEKVRRSLSILPRYLHEIPRCDAVLVFANDLFAITLAPLLLLITRVFHKPFYLKPVGAGLDLFIKAQKKILQKYLLSVLRASNGVLTQTRLLKDDLKKLGVTNTYYLPGCRPMNPIEPVPNDGKDRFRIIFLGHITRRKGPLLLLDALTFLSQICDQQIICDFYGPIHDEIQSEFLEKLSFVPNARYCGVAKPGSGSQLISQYDALVLPTYYDTEGHPGVFIEAMHAGVPVISTRIRTFPELITNGWNGFLVPTRDSCALAEAIHLLAIEPALKEEMGQANRLKGLEFRAENVVAEMLKIIFPDSTFVRVHK
jgi:glycosyltransferase involved in cell wall biosynthesis